MTTLIIASTEFELALLMETLKCRQKSRLLDFTVYQPDSPREDIPIILRCGAGIANAAAAAALATALGAEPIDGQTVAIIGVLDDKDVSGIVSPLVGHVDHWIAVTADSPRAIESGELARQVANLSGSACLAAESLNHSLQQARLLASPADQILVTGSFYLVGPVLSELYSRP